MLRYVSRTHGPDAIGVIDDLDDTWSPTHLLDVENDPDEIVAVLSLENALRFRWSCLGRDFVEGYAASLAQTLHAHEVFVINDIGHIDWANVPSKEVGLRSIDVQILNMINVCDDNVAIDSMVKVQARQRIPKPEFVQKVVNGHIPFDLHKWISPHLEPKVVDLNNKTGILVIGSTEKSSMKPSTEASRLAFEMELEKGSCC